MGVLELLGLVVVAAWIGLPALVIGAFVFDSLFRARGRGRSTGPGDLGRRYVSLQQQPHRLEVDAQVDHPEAHEMPIDPGPIGRPADTFRK